MTSLNPVFTLEENPSMEDPMRTDDQPNNEGKETYLRVIIRKYLKHKMTVVGLIVMAALTIIAIFASSFLNYWDGRQWQGSYGEVCFL